MYVETRPFVEKDDVRILFANVDPELLTWHQDGENREVEVLNQCVGWSYQSEFDIQPRQLKAGTIIKIFASEWHRVIKTDDATDLVLKIKRC